MVLKAKSPMADHPILVLPSTWNKYPTYKTENITLPDKPKYASAGRGRSGASLEKDPCLERKRELNKERTIDETIRTIAEETTPWTSINLRNLSTQTEIEIQTRKEVGRRPPGR